MIGDIFNGLAFPMLSPGGCGDASDVNSSETYTYVDQVGKNLFSASSSAGSSHCFSVANGGSACGWFDIQSQNNAPFIFGLGWTGAANHQWQMRIINNTNITGYWRTSGGVETGLGLATKFMGSQVHLAMTWDGTYIRMYQNGIQQNISSTTLEAVTSEVLQIGHRVGETARQVEMGFCHVAVWNNYCLSAQEVGILANSVKPNAMQKAILMSATSYYPFTSVEPGLSVDLCYGHHMYSSTAGGTVGRETIKTISRGLNEGPR